MQEESMSDKCKIIRALTIFENSKVGARGIRAWVARTNYLMWPKPKFCPNRCKGGAIGA